MGGTSRITATTTGTGEAETERRHTVRRGETLSGIAARYGVTVAEILRANPSVADPDRIRAGQSIVIPERGGNPPASNEDGATYTVRAGDTLSAIAARHGLDLARLRRANLQIANPDRINPGQRLRVPPRTTTPADDATPTPTVETTRTQRTERGANGFARVDLDEFLRAASGSNAPAAIIIGNAEGTRTPDGGFRRGYYGHSDPGNARHNMGSFSYQNSRVRTPEQADRLQLTALRDNIDAYRRAAADAGLDPNDALLASAYFDSLNQSPGAARRFLAQLDYLREHGVTQATVTELRVRSFVNPETGERWRDSRGQAVGGGFANIARRAARRAGRTATEADVVRVIRADQGRRVRDMVAALREQGLAENPPRVEPNNSARVEGGREPAAPRHYTVRDGVVLSERAREVLNQIGDDYFRRTGREFVVTSGTRTPRAQARAMYFKLANGDDLSEYANRGAAAEIRAAYDASRRAGRTADQTIAAMERVIEAQVGRGTYISRHLRGNGADISLRGLDQRAFRASVAASGTGASLLYEGVPPHFHLQF